jgi:hypothetical protein
MKIFPIGASTLISIVDNNCYYVDKTHFVKELVDKGRYYFLSRPRRFGKSLFVDTLKQAFLGQQKYFHGLFLENYWDWGNPYPVIHISFSGGVIASRQQLDLKIEEILITVAKIYEIPLELNLISGKLYELIQKLQQKYQQKVVVLIDEYDKPILDNLTNSQLALTIREGLKNFYSVIKDCDQWLKFVFLTGVSQFSKVSLFSGLNNLENITLVPDYATICGYRESDIKAVFSDQLAGVDFELLRHWYNGYNFLGENVYNPFDVLLYLKHKTFKNYWFETGTPAFLLKLFQEQEYYLPQLEQLTVTEEMLGSFEVEYLSIETLLFQTGYLTIAAMDNLLGERLFTLRYPNLEVKRSLTNYLLNYLIHEPAFKAKNQQVLYQALKNNNLNLLKATVQALFASIPYNLYVNNPMNQYEGYYASVFYCYLAALGVEVIGEDTSSRGRIDLTIKLDKSIYIIEFKVIDLEKEQKNKAKLKRKSVALQQIKDKRYFEKYQSDPQVDIYLLGIEFNPAEKNIEHFEWEKWSE